MITVEPLYLDSGNTCYFWFQYLYTLACILSHGEPPNADAFGTQKECPDQRGVLIISGQIVHILFPLH